jgi:hypothetical protein
MSYARFSRQVPDASRFLTVRCEPRRKGRPTRAATLFRVATGAPGSTFRTRSICVHESSFVLDRPKRFCSLCVHDGYRCNVDDRFHV